MFPLRRAYRGLKRLFKRKPKKVKRVIRRKPRVNGIVSVCKIKQEDRDFVNCNSIESGVYTFELSDFPEYSNYQGVYEYFRIDKVQVTWRAMNNVAQLGTEVISGVSSTRYQSAGRIHTVVDFNDAATPTASRAGIQSMMQDSSYKCTSSNRNHTRTLTPHILMEGGGSSVGVTSRRKQWIPTGNTTSSLTHYALKYIMEGGFQDGGDTNTKSFMYEPTIKMWVSFKDTQ